MWEQNTVGFRDSRFDALVAKAPTEGASTTPWERSFQSLTVLEKKLEKPLFSRTGKLSATLPLCRDSLSYSGRMFELQLLAVDLHYRNEYI